MLKIAMGMQREYSLFYVFFMFSIQILSGILISQSAGNPCYVSNHLPIGILFL